MYLVTVNTDLVFISLIGILFLWCAFFFFIWISLPIWSMPLNAQITVGSIEYWKYNILLGWNSLRHIKKEDTCKPVVFFLAFSLLTKPNLNEQWTEEWPKQWPLPPCHQRNHEVKSQTDKKIEHGFHLSMRTLICKERESQHLWIFMHFVQLLLHIEHEHSLVQGLKPHFSSSWVTAQVIRLQGHIQPSV